MLVRVFLALILIQSITTQACSAFCDRGWDGITYTNLCNDGTNTSCTCCHSTFFYLDALQCKVNTSLYKLQTTLLDSVNQQTDWTTNGVIYQSHNIGSDFFFVSAFSGIANMTYHATLHNHSSIRFRMFLYLPVTSHPSSPGELTITVDGINKSHTFNNNFSRYLMPSGPDYYIYTTPQIPHNGTQAQISIFLNSTTITGYHNVGIKQLMVFTKSCPALCTDCYTQNNTIYCSQCQTDYWYYDGRCHSECPNGTYLSSGFCDKCHQTCGTCTNNLETSCTSCSIKLSSLRFLLNDTCVKVCPKGTYTIFGDFLCAPCPSGCSNCTGPSYDDCYQCEPNSNGIKYFLLAENKGCQTQCPAGQVYISYLNVDKCFYCDLICATCLQNMLSCTSCVTNSTFSLFLPLNNTCLAVCPSNYKNVNGTCICIKEGFWQAGGICQLCHNSCITCFGSQNTQCNSCSLGFYFISNQTTCISRCPTGQFNYFNTTQCIKCSTNCFSCSDFPTSCMSCSNSTYLFNSTCLSICPQGYGATKYPNVCIQCFNGTSSYNNSCVSKCPPLHKIDNTTNSCISQSFDNKDFLDYKIHASFANKGSQLCLTLYFNTKLMVVHDIDDKISITLSLGSSGRLLEATSQDLNVTAVDMDDSLMSLKVFTSFPESITNINEIANTHIIITFYDNTLKAQNGVIMNQYKSFPLNNPSFIRQIYLNFHTSGIEWIGIVFSIIGILLLPLAYFKKFTYYPILQFLMQLQLMRLLSFTLYPVSYNTFAFLKGFDVAQFQWMPNVVDLATPINYFQNSFIIYEFKSATMNFLSLSASNILFMIVFQPILGYMYLYDKQQFIRFIIWAEKILVYSCSINILFAAFSSFVSLFINTQNISILFIVSQLLGLLAIGLLVFFFILQRKNFTRYKMFLATSFAFCILIPFFSKSFPISLVILNICMIVIIVASYKNRKKSDKRTKPLLLGRLLFLIMVNVVELGYYPALVISIGTLFFVGQLAILGYIVYRSYYKKPIRLVDTVKTIEVKDQIKEQPNQQNQEYVQKKEDIIQFQQQKSQQLMYYQERSERSPRKKMQQSKANLRKDSQTYYSPRKNWRNINNKSRTIYKDEQSQHGEDKDKSQQSGMHLSIKPLNDAINQD